MTMIFRYMLFVLLCVTMYACGSDDMDEMTNEDELTCDDYSVPELRFLQLLDNQLDGIIDSPVNNLNKVSWQITTYKDYEGILDNEVINWDTTVFKNFIHVTTDTVKWVRIIVRDSSECLLPNPFVQEEFFFF